VALSIQLGLVITGASVLIEPEFAPGPATRVFRFFSYFTVQSNILVAVAATMLAPDPDRDGRAWRAVSLAGIVGITATGVIHYLLRRPLLDLTGWSAITDTMLHVAVPLLAVVGWLLFGPRPRIDRTTVGLTLLGPLAYMIYTVVAGEIGDWYPYPFTDVGALGYPRVLLNAVAVMAFLLGLAALAWPLDRRLPQTPRTAARS